MSQYGAELHKFIMGEIRTDGWKSPWRIKEEGRRAEDATKPRPVVKAKQIQVRRESKPKEKKERIYCTPKPRYQRVTYSKFCDSCSKGLRKSTKGTKCFSCLRARPKCACGRTVTLAGAVDKCKECFHKANKKKCAMCDNLLNASNQYGLCKPHYSLMRRSIHREKSKQKARELKEAA